MLYVGLDPRFEMEHLGYLPNFVSESDPRPAKEQYAENYAHGGGWRPMQGWQMNRMTFAITYPGDPQLRPFAFTKLRDERIFFYPTSQVAIVQPDGSFEVCRMD